MWGARPVNRRRRSFDRFAALGLTALILATSWLSDATTARAVEPSSPPVAPSVSPEPSQPPQPAVPPAGSEPETVPPPDQPVVVPEPGKDRELIDRRTATTRSWDVGNGQVTSELFPSPIFYQPSGEGDYVPIELDFDATADGRAAVTTSPTIVTVDGQSDDLPVLSLTSAEGFAIAYTPLLPDGMERQAHAPALTGSVADLPDVLPGVDLRVSARSDGANVWLVLAEAPGDPRWTFVLDVPVDTTLRLDDDGAIDVVDDKGEVRAFIAAPYAVDSTPDERLGSGRMTSKLHYEVGTAADGRPTVTTVLDDAEWLASAVYPVYVDPSTTLVGPGSDTYGDTFINQGNVNQNYANYQRPDSPTFYEMWLGESPSDSSYKNTALVKFDISSILGRAIDAAELRLRPYHAYYDAPTERGVWAYRIGSTWTELGVKWSNKPSWTTNSTTTTCAEATTLSCVLDASYWTRVWVNGLETNYGLAVDTDGNNATYWKRLIAAEQVHSTSPRLYVTYHDPVTAVSPNGATVGSRTLAWTYDDTYAGAPQGKYRVEVSNDGFLSTLVTSGDVSGTATSWAIPTTTSLTPGLTYQWRVKVGIGTVPTWSPVANGTFVWDPEVNLGMQSQHTFESWDLGAGDSLAVNVATGNLVVSHPIADLPIRGGSLPITLTYNAHDAADIGFGPGWRLDLQRRLTINANSTVTFTDGDGARHLFGSPSTVGSVTNYAIPATIDAKLVRDTSQTGQEFTLTYKDRSTDVFKTVGGSGLLRYIRDRNGNQVTVNYSGSTAEIATVADPNGRTITFTWNADTIHHVTSIVDWAVVTGGIVQTSGTANRTNRFAYSGGLLTSWGDAKSGALVSCPGGASHQTCLVYSGDLLTSIAKTQTVTTFSTGTLGTATATPTTVITYAGTDATAVRDATQNSTTETKFVWTSADTISLTRKGTPDLVVAYRPETPADAYGRVSTATRAPGGSQVVTKTTWNGTYPAKVASTIEDFGGSLARTTSNTWASGAIGPNLTVTTEPLTGSENRTTTNTYNGNDDITRTVDASSVSGSTTTDYSYTSGTGCAGGLLLCSMIENRVDGTKGGSNGHVEDVTTDYQYDGNGLRTRQTRYNYASGGTLLDSAASGWTYDVNGNVTSEIANYTSGTVTGPTGDDVIPNATTNARTDLTTSYGYDTAGNRVSSADPRRAVETAKGTSLGSDDFIIRWTFDSLNQQVTETTPTTTGGSECTPASATCRQAAATYDELGHIREARDIPDVVTAMTYDLAGRATATYEDPPPTGTAEQTSAAAYDAAGRVLTVKNREQLKPGSTLGVTAYTYDASGRQIAATEGSGSNPSAASTTKTVYDALDRVTCEQVGWTTGTCEASAGTGQTTITTYDIGGRTTKTDDEFTCATTTYDWRDLPLTVVEGQTSGACTGSGLRTVSNVYDGMGRLTQSSITAGQGLNDILAASTFGAAGQQLSTSSTTASITTSSAFSLNPIDQMIAETRSDGGTASSWTRMNYDAAGNPTDRCVWNATPTELCKAVGTAMSPEPAVRTTTAFDARNNRIKSQVAGIRRDHLRRCAQLRDRQGLSPDQAQWLQ